MSIRIVFVLLFAVAGCRGALDRDIDALAASGISVTRNSAGEVFRIDTDGVGLNEHFWSSLGNFKQLRQLAFTGSPIRDADLSNLVSLRSLQSLDLSYTLVTPSGLHVVSRMADLRTLSLNGVRLDHSAVDPLSQLTQLRSLSLIETGLHAEDTASIRQSLPLCLIVL